MFGDYGHGSIIFFFAACLILFHDKIKGSALEGFLKIRFLLLFMGAMACFTGLLYNEFFAIANDWFGSCFDMTARTCTNESTNCDPTYLPVGCTDPSQGCALDCVYPFGVDPAWYLSGSLLTFTNNFKMKLAVIIGVIHMAIGVCVKGANTLFFGHYLELFTEVITGLIILLGLFGWMDFLIFSKWAYPMNPYSLDPTNQSRISYAPSIITVMINNFLAGGYPGQNAEGVEQYFFDGQRGVSLLLVKMVVVCAVLYLYVKPIVLICLMPKKHVDSEHEKDDDYFFMEAVAEDGRVEIGEFRQFVEKEGAGHGTSASEIFIHQFIETTEFVLGCVSNTASYLRLWALSLAHS